VTVNGESRIAWAISDRERLIMRKLGRKPGDDDPPEDLRGIMEA
jgi:hypothetical protein